MLDRWLDRVQNLLDYQKDLQLETVTARFNRTDLIELRIIINSLKDKEKEHETV